MEIYGSIVGKSIGKFVSTVSDRGIVTCMIFAKISFTCGVTVC